MKKNLTEQYRLKKKEQFSLVCDAEKVNQKLFFNFLSSACNFFREWNGTL